ncbi:MAG TPA: DUF5335 family protein [Candidatus Xenobia bacterium]
MATLEIQEPDWPTFFGQFMQRYAGRPCRLELLGEDLGAHIATHGLPLSAIEADIRHPRHEISFLIGDRADKHVTHVISSPTHVRHREVSSGTPATLQIESAGGVTTLLSIEQSG